MGADSIVEHGIAPFEVVRKKMVAAILRRPELSDGFHGVVEFHVHDNEVKVRVLPVAETVRLTC